MLRWSSCFRICVVWEARGFSLRELPEPSNKTQSLEMITFCNQCEAKSVVASNLVQATDTQTGLSKIGHLLAHVTQWSRVCSRCSRGVFKNLPSSSSAFFCIRFILRQALLQWKPSDIRFILYACLSGHGQREYLYSVFQLKSYE